MDVISRNRAGRARLVPTFDSYMARYGRQYKPGSDEYNERFDLFIGRLKEIDNLNERPHRLWTAGLNPLSDRTTAELVQLRGWKGSASPLKGKGRNTLSLIQKRTVELPKRVFWGNLTSLHKVSDQGECGSCWAVTAATVLQAHAEIQGKSRDFSAQELVNCVANVKRCGGSGGCDGATVELAFDWVMRNGLSSTTQVPYRGYDQQCSSPRRVGASFVEGDSSYVDGLAEPGVKLAMYAQYPPLEFGMQGWERLPENQYEPLLRAVAFRGPVAVGSSASAWDSYESGVFDHCPKDAEIDHAITLVGYGEDARLGVKYWIIQNSWGPWWGEAGKIRLLRRDTDSTECGTDHQPEMGTGCVGGPKQVTVCGMCGILYDSVVPHFSL